MSVITPEVCGPDSLRSIPPLPIRDRYLALASQPATGLRLPAGTGDALIQGMERLSRYFTTHPGLMRVASILVLVILAACNNGSEGGGGPGGY